jgi:hypothetical protein
MPLLDGGIAMLQLHKDVWDAYWNAVSVRNGEPKNRCTDCGFKCVQFDGTIVESSECAPGDSRLVARWAVDLTGRIHIKTIGSSMKCGRFVS